jgi:hypothetical protein
MKTRAWIIAALQAFLLASPVAADFRTVELAHEVRLTDVRLPASESGTVGFKTCDDCEFQTERVTVETRWSLNGRIVPLDDFRAALARVTDRGDVYVTVLQHLEDDRVTEVSVYLP